MTLTCPNENSLSSLNQTITSEMEQETCTLGTQTIEYQRDWENVTRQGHTATSTPEPTHDRILEVPTILTETYYFAPDFVMVFIPLAQRQPQTK